MQQHLSNLRDPDPQLRRNALLHLMRLADEDALMRGTVMAALEHMRDHDPQPELRELARRAFRKLSTPPDAPPIDDTLSRPPGPPPPYEASLRPRRRSRVSPFAAAAVLAGAALFLVGLLTLYVLVTRPALLAGQVDPQVLAHTSEQQSRRQRPYTLMLPPGASATQPIPTVVSVAGYRQTGEELLRVLGPICLERGVMLLIVELNWRNVATTYANDLNDILDSAYQRQRFDTRYGGPILVGYGDGAGYAALFAAQYSYDYAAVLLIGLPQGMARTLTLPQNRALEYRVTSGDQDPSAALVSRYVARLRQHGSPVTYEIVDQNQGQITDVHAAILAELLQSIYGG